VLKIGQTCQPYRLHLLIKWNKKRKKNKLNNLTTKVREVEYFFH